MMSNGTQISDMTISLTLPAGSYAPFVVADPATGLSTQVNYQYDLGARFVATDAAIALKASLSALAASGGSSLVGFLELGTDASGQTVENYLQQLYLTPEAFGALGTGVDDSAAFVKLIAAQQLTGQPIRFKAGANYGVGHSGWAGFTTVLSRNLVIDGNGALITLLVQPSQAPNSGNGHVLFKLDGTASNFALIAYNLNVDLGGTRTILFQPWRSAVQLDRIYVYHGGMGSSGYGDASMLLYATGCNGIRVNACRTYEVGYGTFSGNPATGMRSTDVWVTNCSFVKCWREDTADRGAGIHGCVSNFFYAHNTISNAFSGIAMPAENDPLLVCEDGVLLGNQISDTIAQGIQTDVFGSYPDKNIRLIGNRVKTAGVNGAAYYMLHADSIELVGNEAEGCEFGILVDAASNFVISGNTLDATGATSKTAGINVTGQIAAITAGVITGNRVLGYISNIGIGGAGFLVSNIDVTDNQTIGGTNGLHIQQGAAGVTGIWVDGNSFRGHTTDLNNGATNGLNGVQFGDNKFATSAGAWFTASYNPASLAIGVSGAIQTMTVTGAAVGDAVTFQSFTLDLAGAVLTAWISAADTLSYYVTNVNGANPLDLGAGTVAFGVSKK